MNENDQALEADEGYVPPAIVDVGSVASLTAGTATDSTQPDDPN